MRPRTPWLPLLLLACLALLAFAGSCRETAAPTPPAAPAPVLADLAPTSLRLSATLGDAAIGAVTLRNAGTGDLVVTVIPDQPFLELSGARRVAQGETLRLAIVARCPAEPGTYEGSVRLDSSGGADQSQRVEVELTCAAVPPTRGSLAVSISGLAAGLVPAVTVRGPDGFERPLQASHTFLDLVPGAYTVSATEVVEGLDRFVPTVEGSPAQVAAGGLAAVPVRYARVSDVPAPGGSGRIFASGATHDTIPLAWAPAADPQTPHGELLYRAFRSDVANLATAADVEKNGAPLGDWTAGLSEIVASGLEPQTAYFFNVLVKDPQGHLAAYAMTAAFTLADGAPVPGGRGELRVGVAGPDRLALSWAKATDAETAQAELEYRVFFSTEKTLDSVEHVLDFGTPAGEWAADLAALEITELAEATAYSVNVLVRDGRDNLAGYAAVRASTLDVTAPIPSTRPLVQDVRPSSALAVWNAATDGAAPADALAYRAFVATSGALGSLSEAEVSGRELTQGWAADLTEARITGLEPESAHRLKVFVRDPAGNVAGYEEASFTTLAVGAPVPGGEGKVTVTLPDPAAFEVRWTAASDPSHPAGALLYRVYYRDNANMGTPAEVLGAGTPAAGWAPIGEVGSASARLTGLDPETVYWINVVVKNPEGLVAAYRPVRTQLADFHPPEPGELTAEPVPPTSLRLKWTRATDERTPQNEIQYTVYSSKTEPLDAWTDPPRGTRVMDWTADATETVLVDLPPETDFVFNVFARDLLGNVTPYAPLAHRTPKLAAIVVRASTETSTGNMGGRAGADALCQSVGPCEHGLHALVSVSAADQIHDMPALYGVPANQPIYGPTGVRIANDWVDFVGPSMALSLKAAGVADGLYWTGSGMYGGYEPYNCTGWTATVSVIGGGTSGSGSGPSVAAYGYAGDASRTDSGWLSFNARACTESLPVLCLCY